ncbi:MAG: DUF368 domain-containing protein [Oscillospiraceae bacterium]
MKESRNSEKRTEEKLQAREEFHSEAYRKKSLRNAAVGAVIGIGAILPGVSGGVMAVSLGLWRPMIDSIAGFFKSPWRNLLFLAPIGIGAALGLLLGSMALNTLAVDYYTQIMYLFLGLVAGGIPAYLKEANTEGFRPRYLIATVVGALLASTLLFLERDVSSSGTVETLASWEAVLSGAILAVGTVVPGISTSFILMYLGWYRPAMAAVANFDILTLLFLGIGAVGFALLTIRAARWLFNRFRGYAYYGVLGFLIVSAVLIFPGFSGGWGQLVSILLAAGGFFVAILFGKLGH